MAFDPLRYAVEKGRRALRSYDRLGPGGVKRGGDPALNVVVDMITALELLLSEAGPLASEPLWTPSGDVTGDVTVKGDALLRGRPASDPPARSEPADEGTTVTLTEGFRPTWP